MADAPKLKDHFTPTVIAGIGRRIQEELPTFDTDSFTANVVGNGWEDLTFTERAQRIGDELWKAINLPVKPALDVLVATLPPERETTEGVLNEGFTLWPYSNVIATYAVSDLDAGLHACYELTKRFTAEFAIRPFLEAYPEALDRVARWVDDPNEHVRRLASEGTRPRLPWATRLDLPIDKVVGILQGLRRDPSPYVRRSVANHLNDLAKGDSDTIVTLLEQWLGEDVPETTWIARHALRNHLKNGDRRVLAMFGYPPPQVSVEGLVVTPTAPRIGDTITVSFDVVSTSASSQKMMVDLVVGYRKANGSLGPKVFKLRNFELPGCAASAGVQSCTKKLPMVERSTRKLHPGTHSVTVRVNGQDLATTAFGLQEL